MSQTHRPLRNCRNRTIASQPPVSSTSLQRQAQARDRARADARASSYSQGTTHHNPVREHISVDLN